jgi:hypothetical protein
LNGTKTTGETDLELSTLQPDQESVLTLPLKGVAKGEIMIAVTVKLTAKDFDEWNSKHSKPTAIPPLGTGPSVSTPKRARPPKDDLFSEMSDEGRRLTHLTLDRYLFFSFFFLDIYFLIYFI